ncbi:hypothetical protein EJB05_35114, partial [Eragrostis curvula]
MVNGGDESNDGADGVTLASDDAPKRGRGERRGTKMRPAPHNGKLQLIKPKGSAQFKRLYPGVVKIYDEEGKLIDKRAACSWNDFSWKKNEYGVTYARLSLFTVSRQDRRKAGRNLEAYLVKRVSDMIHQARLDAIKLYYSKRKEKCDDKRARTIHLTEAEYLTCKQEWCSTQAWEYLSRYWTTEEYFKKRRRAQESRLKSEEDVAQNRGGSRPWAETQQFLEYKGLFGRASDSAKNRFCTRF